MNYKEVLNHWVSPKRTICEVVREINDLVEGWDLGEYDSGGYGDKIKSLLLEALTMSKKMDAKLTEYKKGWAEGIYKNNKDYWEDIKRRGTRV